MPRSTVSEPPGQQAGDPGDRPGDRPVARALRAERAVRSVPVVPVRDLRVPAAAGAIGSTISGHSAQMLLARNAGLAHLAGLDEDEGGRSHGLGRPRPFISLVTAESAKSWSVLRSSLALMMCGTPQRWQLPGRA